MGRNVLILSLVVILLLGCANLAGAATYNDLSYEQVPIYWDCIGKCWDTGYTRDCALACIETAAKYVPPADSCKDTDGGIDYLNKGTITSQYGQDEDECYDFGGGNVYLFEGACNGNSPVTYQKNCKELGSSYSCVKGACVSSLPPNSPPVFNELLDTKGFVGEAIDIPVSATDKDGDFLYYWLEGQPQNSYLYAQNHFYWGQPTEGEHKVTFVVWDGTVEVKKTITLSIGKEQKAWCKDDDGLDWLKKSKATGLKFPKGKEDFCFDDKTLIEMGCVADAVVEYTKDCKEIGVAYSCVKGECVKGNSLPIFDKIGDITIPEGKEILLLVKATDVDGDKLIYSVTDLQKGATFYGQKLRWIPNYQQAGVYSVKFTVSDGNSKVTSTIKITVTDNIPSVKCGETITKSTKLTSAVMGCINKAIIIGANNIIFDCDNNYIVGPGDQNGVPAISIVQKTGVTIKNCRIKWYGDGIKNSQSNKNIITDNTIVNIKGTGISLSDSNSNVISNNFVSNYGKYGDDIFGEHGISLDTSNYNKVSNNFVSKQRALGIDLSSSENNVVSYNTVFNNEHSGISLLNENHQNTIMENNISYNVKYGILLSGGANENIIWKNNIIDNKKGNSKESNINKNSHGKIFDWKSYWFKGKIGNYWSNYDEPSEGCKDNDGNGICDSPYVIDADTNDNFPYTKKDGWKK